MICSLPILKICTNNTILFQFGFLSWISVQKYAHLNRDVKMGPFIYQSRKMGQSYTVSLEKGGLSYTWQRWKRRLFGPHIRTMSYIGSYPPPPPPPPEVFILKVERVLEVVLNKDNLLHFFHQLTTRVSQYSGQPVLGCGVRNPHTWTPGIIIRTNRV